MDDCGRTSAALDCSFRTRAMGVLTWWACTAIVMLVAGCGSEQAPTFTSAEPPEPASARLFLNGGDVTHHLPLNSGTSQDIEVRVFAANGVRIAGYDDHFAIAMEFTPATLVAVAEVGGKPMFRALTPTALPDTPGALRVTVTHGHTTSSRAFGPFEVLIH